jgi:hypothetical protein
MTLADLMAGDAVFLDANTFVYHFGPIPNTAAPARSSWTAPAARRSGRSPRRTSSVKSPTG